MSLDNLIGFYICRHELVMYVMALKKHKSVCPDVARDLSNFGSRFLLSWLAESELRLTAQSDLLSCASR